MNSEKTRTIIRLIAGIYLGYLGIQLLDEESRASGILMPIVGVLFILCAAFIVWKSVKPFLKDGQISLEGPDDENAIEANAIETDVTELDVTEAEVTEAEVTEADVPEADVTEAEVPEADVTEADVTGADAEEVSDTDAAFEPAAEESAEEVE